MKLSQYQTMDRNECKAHLMALNVLCWFTNQSKISSSFVVALDITIIFINIGKVDPILGGIHGFFKLISELAVSSSR
jgi:hypothetical protein